MSYLVSGLHGDCFHLKFVSASSFLSQCTIVGGTGRLVYCRFRGQVVVAKRSSIGDEGYEEALEFLQTPLADGSGPDALWRGCGNLLTSLHPDFVESLYVASLDDESRKCFNYWLVPLRKSTLLAAPCHLHIEDLVSVNLALVYVLSSCSTNISLGVNKILSAGSASKNSILYLFQGFVYGCGCYEWCYWTATSSHYCALYQASCQKGRGFVCTFD
jgi:hypothetical protein